MHAPSLHNWHIFDPSITFVKHHHMFVEVFLFLVLIVVLFSMVDTFTFFDAPRDDMSKFDAGSVKPLTSFVDPDRVHEYTLRKTYITTALEHLVETSGVERAYTVVYSSRPSLIGQGFETRIYDIFEASRAHNSPHFRHITGLSRWNWLVSHENARHMRAHPNSHSPNYGFELYDESHTAIAYVGFERKRGEPAFHNEQVAQLRETAVIIKQGLLQSLHSLERPSS